MNRCPKCRVANSEQAIYCNLCGSLLKNGNPGKSGKKPYRRLFLAAVAMAVLAILWRFGDMPQTGRTPTKPLSKPDRPNAVLPPPVQWESTFGQPPKAPIELTRGRIQLKDIAGNTLVYGPTAVAAGGWLALPLQRSLGGHEWILHLDPGQQAAVIEGIQDDRDDVGLWRVSSRPHLSGPRIVAWQSEGPMEWVSLADLSVMTIAGAAIEAEQRWFARVRMIETPAEDGIIVQDDAVVGWTFAEFPGRGYMWRGPESTNIVADVRVDDHYRLTFAGGREEALILALSMGAEYSDSQRLAALANAFRVESRIESTAIFSHLHITGIISQMRLLMDGLKKDGLSADVANTFDAAILASMADAALTAVVIKTTRQVYGHENALWLLEDVMERWPAGDPVALDRFAVFRSNLYQDWIRVSIADEDSMRAWQIFERVHTLFPDDPQIALLGARLALKENDWQTAERLLQGMLFPSELADDIQIVQMRISALKAQENKIVIRFNPGSKQIPVNATLNERLKQSFIVDTGATLVTIPISTAEQLGISQLDRLPRRTVHTAGGTRQAPELVLASVTLDGWQVRNVTALVLDLPGQSELGLLGLNFLNRFRVDLDSEQGLLLLEPR
jgi:clan AA aspartic protease (TIGR02281 family)